MGNESELNIKRTCAYCINLDRLSYTLKNKLPNSSGLNQRRLFFFLVMLHVPHVGQNSVSTLSLPYNQNYESRHHLAQCQSPQHCEKNILQGQTSIIKCLTWKWQVVSAYTLGRTSQRGPQNTTVIYTRGERSRKTPPLIGLSWQLKALVFIKPFGRVLGTLLYATKYLLLLFLITIIFKLNKFIIFGGHYQVRFLLTQLHLAKCFVMIRLVICNWDLRPYTVMLLRFYCAQIHLRVS